MKSTNQRYKRKKTRQGKSRKNTRWGHKGGDNAESKGSTKSKHYRKRSRGQGK